MIRSVEGIFRNGKVELLEVPVVSDDVRVIVTFLSENGRVDLAGKGITPLQAADLRGRLAAFVEDWDRPDMDAYDAL